MKTIITIIISFIAISVMGQNLTGTPMNYDEYMGLFPEYNEASGISSSHPFTVDDDSKILTVYGIEAVTIDLLLKYKQECYNDSSFYSINSFCLDSIEAKQDSLIYKIQWNLAFFIKNNNDCYSIGSYKQKEPAFEDFLNWIEK